MKMPLLELMDEPAGPFCKLNVNVCAGMFVSLAELVKLMVVPATTVRLEIVARVGGVFETGAFVVVTKTPQFIGPKVVPLPMALKVKFATPFVFAVAVKRAV